MLHERTPFLLQVTECGATIGWRSSRLNVELWFWMYWSCEFIEAVYWNMHWDSIQYFTWEQSRTCWRRVQNSWGGRMTVLQNILTDIEWYIILIYVLKTALCAASILHSVCMLRPLQFMQDSIKDSFSKAHTGVKVEETALKIQDWRLR